MEIDNKIKKENNTSFMKNVLMLMIAQVVIKILGFVYRIVITNIDGFGDIGNRLLQCRLPDIFVVTYYIFSRNSYSNIKVSV